jgi:hypothetical protein
MKKSVKWLLIIGIIWLVIAIFLSYKVCEKVTATAVCPYEGGCSSIDKCGISNVIPIFLYLSIPSAVLFIIALILYFIPRK